jgi:hypothetical protein
MENNTNYFEKNKNLKEYKPISLTPLTILKPFILSSNNSKMLMKKRLISTNIENINNKIKEVMRKKCEKINNNIFIDKKFNKNEISFLNNLNNFNNQNNFDDMFNKNNTKLDQKKLKLKNVIFDEFNLELNEYDNEYFNDYDHFNGKENIN